MDMLNANTLCITNENKIKNGSSDHDNEDVVPLECEVLSCEDIPEFVGKHSIKGFLDHEEGTALYDAALQFALQHPALEVGSYCGLSSLYIGIACQKNGRTLYAVDHHRGSEEHQLGEEYHDPDLFDSELHVMNSFPLFRKTIELAALNQTIVPLVCESKVACRDWHAELGFVFIDGGHSDAMSMQDCLQWSEKVARGGVLAIHDIFECPEEGGQGPFMAMTEVLARGEFEVFRRVKSLVLLRKT